MKRRDNVGDLEAAVFDQLAAATDLARRLALLCRLNQATALALAEVRGKQNERLLCQLIAAEHPGRKRKARKGRNGPVQ